MKNKLYLFLFVLSFPVMALDQTIHCRKSDELRREITVEEVRGKATIIFSYHDINGDEVIAPFSFGVQMVGGFIDRDFMARDIFLKTGFPLEKMSFIPKGTDPEDKNLFGARLEKSPAKGFQGEYICGKNTYLELAIDKSAELSSFDEGLILLN